jgi:hypothetical protein
MFSNSDPGDVDTALALYETATTALIAAARANPTGDAVARLLRGLEAQRNRVAVAEHALIAETESLGVAPELACPSTANWLSQLLRIRPPRRRRGSGRRRSWVHGVG